MAEGNGQRRVLRLSELREGEEAVCFALLVEKFKGLTKRNEPFVRCHFRDRTVKLEAPIWATNKLLRAAEDWVEGQAYRLVTRLDNTPKYGKQLEIAEARLASDRDDAADGFRFEDLVEASKYDTSKLMKRIEELIEKNIVEPRLNQLVRTLLTDNAELFRKMPAASDMHHSFTAGLLEHVWSMTEVAASLARHYAGYYSELNPPLDRGLVVAAAILHDIGKLRELRYDPSKARYTKEGSLIGHVLMGRDMVREAAAKIEGFPAESLLLLEHAILAHHGKREFGAPVLPQTLEALLVSYVDEMDAKMNSAARERLRSVSEGEFTDRVYPLDNRRFYKGVPVPPPDDVADEGA